MQRQSISGRPTQEDDARNANRAADRLAHAKSSLGNGTEEVGAQRGAPKLQSQDIFPIADGSIAHHTVYYLLTMGRTYM